MIDVCGVIKLDAFDPLASLRLPIFQCSALELWGSPQGRPWSPPQGWQMFLRLAPAHKAPTPRFSHSLWFITPRAPCPTWLYVATKVAVQWCVQALLSFRINGSFLKKSYLIPQRPIKPFMGLKRIVHCKILKLLPSYLSFIQAHAIL